MADEYNLALMVAAVLNALAAALHVGVILVGAAWYRLFGAGERFARAAEAGKVFPAAVTSLIALVLLVWAAYALAGATVIDPLPLLRPALCAITVIYLLRGLAGAFMLADTGRSNRFIVISSLVCIGFGVVHLVGLVQMWERLA
ncbi:hypothetical protein NUH87_03680 [Pseudomonas batumici]|uniref:hypothetical protein n=1 Tax=Pseudomonas batumici TaxID=226910 RepID=UPI0030CC4DC2